MEANENKPLAAKSDGERAKRKKVGAAGKRDGRPGCMPADDPGPLSQFFGAVLGLLSWIFPSSD